MRTNLKVFRVRLKLTQGEMAAKIGVSRVVYANVERGRNKGKEKFWNNLQKAFNVPDEEMYALMRVED